MAKITFLDGNLDNHGKLGEIIEGLASRLEEGDHDVTVLRLRDKRITKCTGCWSCWVKTPGECPVKDDGDEVRRAWLHADLLILASPLRAGFVSATLKTAVDKFIPLAHPYIQLFNGECMHQHRYDKLPPLGVLLEPGPSDQAEDLRVTSDWVARLADQCRVPFVVSATTSDPLDSTAVTIERFLAGPASTASWQPPTKPTPVPIPEVPALKGPHRLLVLSGSPRATSNTAILMDHLCKGFRQHEGNVSTFLELKSRSQREKALAAWNKADLVVFGLPLYVHAMPGHLKLFFETLENTQPRPGRRVAFVVQSGFPEAHHSRWLEQYLARLPARWDATYLGTVVRGGIEGIQIKPPFLTKKLYAQFAGLGDSLGRHACLDRKLVKAIAACESLSPFRRQAFSFFRRIGLTNCYWNKQLRDNGAFEQRFARPLSP
ncbi:MAG: flavodoxin family protein [Deltaproteobacteria bacterium]|nr:flavodoxin family protein [Deltaproteobacteria bacterium]